MRYHIRVIQRWYINCNQSFTSIGHKTDDVYISNVSIAAAYNTIERWMVQMIPNHLKFMGLCIIFVPKSISYDKTNRFSISSNSSQASFHTVFHIRTVVWNGRKCFNISFDPSIPVTAPIHRIWFFTICLFKIMPYEIVYIYAPPTSSFFNSYFITAISLGLYSDS